MVAVLFYNWCAKHARFNVDVHDDAASNYKQFAG